MDSEAVPQPRAKSVLKKAVWITRTTLDAASTGIYPAKQRKKSEGRHLLLLVSLLLHHRA
jgi:hypothetical protein